MFTSVSTFEDHIRRYENFRSSSTMYSSLPYPRDLRQAYLDKMFAERIDSQYEEIPPCVSMTEEEILFVAYDVQWMFTHKNQVIAGTWRGVPIARRKS